MMTTAIQIRRNKDGQQNLNDLRKALAKTKHSIYKQGGNWIALRWSDSHNAFMAQACPWHWTERQAIQYIIGEVESADEARYHAGK